MAFKFTKSKNETELETKPVSSPNVEPNKPIFEVQAHHGEPWFRMPETLTIEFLEALIRFSKLDKATRLSQSLTGMGS